MRYYCVFEGGGALGVDHLGVLKVIEDHKLDVRGFAGASAGAIVAALACVGYSTTELIDFSKRKTILEDLGLNSATELFGRDWKKIQAFSNLTSYQSPFLMDKTHPKSASLDHRSNLEKSINLGYLVARGLLSAGIMFATKRQGLASLDTFCKFLDHALSLKLLEKHGIKKEKVTFWDISEVCGDLRIVATDINTKKIQVFSSAHTPNVAISDAVAASICIPFIFEPRKLELQINNSNETEPHFFFDGWLISNLPLWVFDEATKLDREAVAILSEIHAKNEITDLQKRFGWFVPTVKTAIFGSKELLVRGRGRMLRASITPQEEEEIKEGQENQQDDRMHFLSFDAKLYQVEMRVRRAKTAFQLRFEAENALLIVLKLLKEKIEAKLRDVKLPTERVRISVAMFPFHPERDFPPANSAIQLRYCVGFEFDADYWLALSYQRSNIGQSIRERKIRFLSGTKLCDGHPSLLEDEDRLARSATPKDLDWQLSIPLRRTSEAFDYKRFALCVDGCSNVELNDSMRNILLDEVLGLIEDEILDSGAFGVEHWALDVEDEDEEYLYVECI